MQCAAEHAGACRPQRRCSCELLLLPTLVVHERCAGTLAPVRRMYSAALCDSIVKADGVRSTAQRTASAVTLYTLGQAAGALNRYRRRYRRRVSRANQPTWMISNRSITMPEWWISSLIGFHGALTRGMSVD